MGWPEYVYLGFTMLGLGYIMSRDGEPREGNHSIWISGIVTALVNFLLYMGGFFS